MFIVIAMMFCVGTSIGNDPKTVKDFKLLPKRLMLLPVATILALGPHLS